MKIALAADTRTIVPDGYVLIHKALRLRTPDQWERIQRLPLNDREAINDSLNDIDDAIEVLLTSRLGVSCEVIAAALSISERALFAEFGGEIEFHAGHRRSAVG